MIRHIVLIRFDDDADQTRIDRYISAVQDLPTLIPEIVEFTAGRDIGKAHEAGRGDNWDFVVSSTFRTFDDYSTYAEHPEHKALVDRYLVGLMRDRAALQIETADVPAWPS